MMIIFDDWKSYVHLIFGFFTGFLPLPFKIVSLISFAIYQFVEYVIIKLNILITGGEAHDEVLSDITEFMIGLGLANLFQIF
ncbi:MAG: hypothetical protein QW186_08730 [Candidatus Bathyarchaeia archaeon]